MSAIEENFSALWVISEESQRTGNLDVDRANIVISNYRKNMMKTIYHVGLFNSKEVALRSSWLLATEFGDVGTLELMIQFEEFWDEENQTTFLEHRAILQERLST